MKKILLITSYFPPRKGGISNFLSNIYNSLKKENDFFVFTDQYLSNEKDSKIIRKTFFSRILWPRWIPLIFKTYRQVKINNIELLQAGQLIPIGTVCYLLNKIIGIKYHVFVYGQDMLIARNSKRKTKVIKKVLKNADKVIANSSYTKQLALKNGAHKDKIIVVYPIPKNLKIRHYSSDEILKFKKQKELSDKRVILSVGNLVKRKGQDMVIKSVLKLANKYHDLIYLIIGSGPNYGDLNKLIERFNLTKNVKILQNITDDELPLYYASCDLLVMPSRFLKNKNNMPTDVEGFGMVFLEANLYGKPVIGGNVGGQIDAIEDKVSGFLVDPESTKNIAKKIELLLDNKELLNQIGISSKKRVSENFNWTTEIGKIKKIIE